MTKPTSALTHQELCGFLATIPPDADEQRLADALRTVEAQLSALRSRESAASKEIASIDAELVDASAKQQDQLLTRRAHLVGEIQSLPTQIAIVTRRYVAAHLAWLARVRQLAQAEADRASAEVEPINEQARDEAKDLAKVERQKEVGYVSPQDFAERQALVYAHRRELHEQSQPARDQLSRARLVAEVCEIQARRYGEKVALAAPYTWEDAAQRMASLARPSWQAA